MDVNVMEGKVGYGGNSDGYGSKIFEYVNMKCST